ncbi:uncharacterized protein LAESUDRAFT_746029 [Laetiporus sulphureus 93-53]|uniref:Uncharacterized protein n=1 Tax=Laetiporus sulphureus 93-53 TaxID=1314785 RepID=A0A165AVZ1_9APHY|nr:uncharacterized protein LAESUDRAFT_746029 [Laetiporus sulphureus 93-53]KZS99767.1 hypothetical protein LAESUDRAFT_746029 [Laetiporus sulphureus 93-53]
MVEKVRADPENLGCNMVDCINRRYSAQAPPQDTLSNDSDALTVVSPALISKFEMTYWYHGISGNPPKLMWRSDFEANPFPIPALRARFFKIPHKTAHGVFNTPLNAVWDTVAPQILASMKAHGLKYSALKTVRFSIVEDGKEETLGPVVVWIAVRPNTINAEGVHNATPDILDILAESQITDVVVEWYEGSVERLVGPPLMSVKDNTSPIFGLNHPFNTGLGIPIARQSDDAQGTLTFLFREMKASNGDPSDRILALTNKHVASVDTTTHYELDAANPQHILVCGERRLARAVVEIEDAVNTGFRDAIRHAGELAALKLKSGGANSTALGRKQTALDAQNEDNATLQTFFDEVQANWQDTNGRRLGEVDWAPEISVRVDDRNYTRDIATFAVDGEKLENFERKIVDLGNQYSAGKLEDPFWPIAAVRGNRNIPADLQLPITRALPRRLVNSPDTEDKNGEPLYIVAKYGGTTKLSLGRYSGMEAYTCTDLGLESRDVVVYKYGKNSGDFEVLPEHLSGRKREMGREIVSRSSFMTEGA